MGGAGRDGEVLAAYRATAWSVRLGGASLRLAAGRPAPAALGGGFAIITAYNPASRLRPAAVNRAASRGLRRRLEAAGRAWLPARAHGTGADARRWDEPGFVLLGAEARELAVALGAELGQNAVLVGRGGARPVLVATRRGFCGRQVGDPLDP